MKRKSSFVTITQSSNSKKKSVTENFPSNLSRGTSEPKTVHLPGSLWERKTFAVEECCYHIIQRESGPFAIFSDEDIIPRLSGTLKSLFPQVSTITSKTPRGQATKLLNVVSTSKDAVVILGFATSSFVGSCMPSKPFFRIIVHVGTTNLTDYERRNALGVASSGAGPLHIHIEITPVSSSMPKYEYNKGWMPMIQQRISVARKLFDTTCDCAVAKRSIKSRDLDGSDEGPGGADSEEPNSAKAMASKVEALRNKMRILLAMPLPDSSGAASVSTADTSKSAENADSKVKPTSEGIVGREEGSTGTRRNDIKNGSSGTSSATVTTTSSSAAIDDTKTMREKMGLLGMLSDVSQQKGGQLHILAEAGRSLAATRWIDGYSGKFCGACWDTVRYGASYDSESLKVREIIDGFRQYVASKSQQGKKVPKRWEEEELASAKLRRKFRGECKVVGFGWRPHNRGDDDWGGAYGKCCGHNEVTMFYCRPFAPMEVLNTHVCSKASPAPGNEGYDGCMEFLQAQCKFFSRPMSVWDDNYFHYIGSDGVDRPLAKKTLLSCPPAKLRLIMDNMRHLTVFTGGNISPQKLLDAIDMYLLLACCQLRISGLLGIGNTSGKLMTLSANSRSLSRIYRTIGSFLLVGSKSAIEKLGRNREPGTHKGPR